MGPPVSDLVSSLWETLWREGVLRSLLECALNHLSARLAAKNVSSGSDILMPYLKVIGRPGDGPGSSREEGSAFHLQRVG